MNIVPWYELFEWLSSLRGFKWSKNVDGFDVNSVSEKSAIGYILEVDLEYPDELDVLHNDSPLAPEKIAVSFDMLSDYCWKIADEQSYWVKKYIDFNTETRTNATNGFEKDFFKLMINSVDWKTMENLRKRINARLINNKKYF